MSQINLEEKLIIIESNNNNVKERHRRSSATPTTRVAFHFEMQDQINTKKAKLIESFEHLEATTHPETILTWKEKPRRCLIIKKINDEECSRDLLLIANWLEKNDIQVFVEPAVHQKEFQQFKSIKLDHPGRGIDFIIVLGGDGTLLYLSSLFQNIQTVPPIISFARGSLGFLTPFDFNSHETILKNLLTLNQRQKICVRMRLTARIWKHPNNVQKKSVSKPKNANHSHDDTDIKNGIHNDNNDANNTNNDTNHTDNDNNDKKLTLNGLNRFRSMDSEPKMPVILESKHKPTVSQFSNDSNNNNDINNNNHSVNNHNGNGHNGNGHNGNFDENKHDSTNSKVAHTIRHNNHSPYPRKKHFRSISEHSTTCYELKHIEAGNDNEDIGIMATKNFFPNHVRSNVERHVLNEVVVHRDGVNGASMICCDLFMDGKNVTTVFADGFIISTPTGSTAYSVSAGGSLISPTVPCIALTPICPHTLSFRPVIVPDSTIVHLQVPLNARYGAMVNFDGKHPQMLEKGDIIEIVVSRYPVPTFKSQKYQNEWFGSLIDKFNWNLREAQKPL